MGAFDRTRGRARSTTRTRAVDGGRGRAFSDEFRGCDLMQLARRVVQPGAATRTRRTTRRVRHPQQVTTVSSIVSTGRSSRAVAAAVAASVAASLAVMASDVAVAVSVDARLALESASSLARALVAHRSSARERRLVEASALDASLELARSRSALASGVSGNDNARGVPGASPSDAGANSKLASPSPGASSSGPRAAGVVIATSVIALRSFGTNLSFIVSISEPLARAPSAGDLNGVAPSPRLRTDACALILCARTRAAYASYSSNAADPFFSTYA